MNVFLVKLTLPFRVGSLVGLATCREERNETLQLRSFSTDLSSFSFTRSSPKFELDTLFLIDSETTIAVLRS